MPLSRTDLIRLHGCGVRADSDWPEPTEAPADRDTWMLQAKAEAWKINAEYWEALCMRARDETRAAKAEQPAFFRYGFAWGAILATAAVALVAAIAWRWQ
jgi:hypothetical protein